MLSLPLLFIWARSILPQRLLGDLRVSRLFLLSLLEGLQVLFHLVRTDQKKIGSDIRCNNSETSFRFLPSFLCFDKYMHVCSLRKHEHTELSSVRSCWFKLLLSSSRDSRPWIFSSLSSRVFLSADSIFVSRILYLLKDEKVECQYITMFNLREHQNLINQIQVIINHYISLSNKPCFRYMTNSKQIIKMK